MKKNVSSQTVGIQMVSATDGSAFTSTTTVYITVDGGTQALGSTGSGVCTHEGNGFHSYVPTSGETNGDHIAFTFIGTGAVPSTVQVYTSFPQTGDTYALANGSTGFAAIDTVVDAILVDTAEIGAAGAGLTAIPWNASWDAEVQSECTDALNAYDAPTKAELDSGLAALNDLSAAEVNAEVDTALADYDAPTKAELDSGLAALNDPTAAAIADAVWDETAASHVASGSTGEALGNATAPTAAQVADAVWEEAIADHSGTSGSTAESLAAAGGSGDPWITSLPGSYTGTQAGKILADILDDTGTTIPGTIATVDANVDAILADTAEIGAAGAGLTALATASALATVDSNVDAILVDTGTTLPATLGALPTATQNADALLNRDMSAVSDTNARTPLNAMRFLRNKWSVAGTTLSVTKEDDSTEAWTATVTADSGADPITGSDPA